MNIQILVYNGCDELDAIAPLEVLRNATTHGAAFATSLVALHEPGEIVASHGMRFWPDAKLSVGKGDILLVPGGNWATRAAQGAWAEAQRGEIPAAIALAHGKGATLAAVCTGTMLIAQTGLLNGRPAMTHHSAVDELRASGAEVVAARVVDDGDIITAGGVTSGLDLALWLVERWAGAHIALKVEKLMEYERRGTVWRR